MNVSDLIKRLEAMPPEAEVLTCHVFGQYNTVDGLYHHTKENKVALAGGPWEG